MKYLISLLKYILIVIVIIAIFTGLRIVLPQGDIELTYNQAIAFVNNCNSLKRLTAIAYTLCQAQLIMKKVFIFSICGECDEPTGIIEPCTELGYNNFPSTNFHGELSIKETEQLRQKLIQSLKDEGKLDKANYIENNTRVMEVTFNCA